MTLSGFMPNASATSLESIVLTRSGRRVQRSARGGTPQPSRRWLIYAVEAGDRPALVPFVTITCGLAGPLGLVVARRPRCLVDVAHAQAADLVAGSAVEQREDPEQRFMRVSVTARRPAAVQLALLVQEEGLAGDSRAVRPRGAGEDDLAAAGEAEELPQHGQPPLPRDRDLLDDHPGQVRQQNGQVNGTRA
jgi:hypothetical protein